MRAPETVADEQLAALRHMVGTATQRLLGDTIAVSDDEWRAPSRLPGWRRGHVATHLARQADALRRLTNWAITGVREDMYASPTQRQDEIQAGAVRPGVELQIDLDGSAGRLDAALDAVEAAGAWNAEIELRGGRQVPARMLPLARLTEVVLHHVDLDIGYHVEDIDETMADWLLEWSAFRLRARDDFPRLALASDSGMRISLGSSGDAAPVTGTSQQLLGWLTGRSPASVVQGSNGLVLPSF